MSLDQYICLGEYCGHHTSFVFLILLLTFGKRDVKNHKGELVLVVGVVDLIDYTTHFDQVTWAMVDEHKLPVGRSSTLTVLTARDVTFYAKYE